VFVPEAILLAEGGSDKPYDWSMRSPLTWTGAYRGRTGRLLVPASPERPFETDLASVPRFLTWLFPRYGKYTKAAVLHDYLCQTIGRETIEVFPTPEDPGAPELLALRDRSDADEVFRLVMAELGVPWLRRWLMWAAVSWATLALSLRTGRASHPLARWIGRLILCATLVGVGLLLWWGVVGAVVDASWGSTGIRIAVLVVVAGAAVAGCLLLAGYVAQARWERALDSLGALGMTVLALPLLPVAAAIAVMLAIYLFVEDAFAGFRSLRAWLARRRAEATPLAERTPRAERIEAVRAS
jgi:hypothetical protein